MLLADLGATVLKIERPGAGDDTRQWGPPFAADGTATYFQAVNRNKRSVAIDLRSAGGQAQTKALARDADVVVENFRPGLMDELGLGYAELNAENSRLIYCSLTGFGAQAPEMPGYDLLVQALGGLMSITGPADGEPQKVGVALVDVLAGLFATVGVLAALRERDLSGIGQRVEVDLLSSLLAALVNQSSGYTVAGVVPQRMGNRHPSVVPYESLRCADSSVVIAVGNDRQFKTLATVLGVPQLAEDPRFATNPARVTHREALVVALEARLETRPAEDWAATLTAARVPAGVVNDIAGAFALAERLGLEPTVSLPRADGTTVSLPRNPVRLSRTPVSYRTAPPELDCDGAAGWD
jgi:crotonobetainyl-CoA:carnitine CoA-transferase CaiB-like acyl-CoA transferase